MNHINRRAGQLRARRVLRILRSGSMLHKRHFYADDSPAARRMFRTRTVCSCLYCGNPRRHFGKATRQERLARLREREQIAEYYERFLGDWFRCEECGTGILQAVGWCGECCNALADDALMRDWVLEWRLEK